MKTITTTILILLNFAIYAQQTSINDDGTPPHNSAMVDVKSTDKGFLMPRLTTAEIEALPTPATGLVVYNTDFNEWMGYNGTEWRKLGINGCTPPAQPGSVTGKTSVCENATGEPYSITAVAGATSYTWTAPAGATITTGQGTTSITADFTTTSGDMTVYATNSCGNSAVRKLSINVKLLPVQPSPIVGNANVYANALGEPYSITAVSGATSYTWSVPVGAIIVTGQGTTNITVDFGNSSGNISVYATNDCGNSSTRTLSITFLNSCSTATAIDIDGNVYNTIGIGTQCWLKQDLRVTHYPNGNTIPHIPNSNTWGSLSNNNTDDAYCFYNNNSSTIYGALYTYAAAIGDNWTRDNYVNQGVCPDGWHLPNNDEWVTLTDFLGGTGVAGGKMKETGTTHWNSPNTGATNVTDFTALPNGYRDDFSDPHFVYRGKRTIFRSATEGANYYAFGRKLYNTNDDVYTDHSTKKNGFPVRCIKD